MVYANSHPEAHDKEIKALVKILLDGQYAEGYWTYPVHVRNGDRGDTSITQYALLGLWEAERVGIAVPPGVWDKAAAWLASTQDSDGAFWYHPGNQAYPPTQFHGCRRHVQSARLPVAAAWLGGGRQCAADKVKIRRASVS